MAGLDDFKDSNVTLQDLSQEEVQSTPKGNPASNNNMASMIALNSNDPTQVERIYRDSYGLLEDGSQPEEVKSMLEAAKEGSYTQSKSALIDYLADPQYSDEDKMKVSTELMNMDSSMYDLRKVTYEKSLGDDNDDESGEVEFVRLSLTDAINEVDEYQKDRQYLLNSELSKTSTDTMEVFADTVGFLLPFAEGKATGDVLEGLRKGEDWAYNETMTLLGSSKMDIKDMIKSLPIEERRAFNDTLVNLVNSHSGIVLAGDNEYARYEMLQTFLDDGYYTDVDKWIDNAVSVLDWTVLAAPLARLAKGGNRVFKGMSDGVKITKVQPASTSQIYKDANPSKAKATHELAMSDESGEAAQATYGADRVDVALNDLGPEAAKESGAVNAKVSNIDSIHQNSTEVQKEIFEYTQNSGALYYWKEDKEALRSHVVNNFSQMEGMRVRKEMFQVEDIPDGVKIKGVYGPSKSGYSEPQQAVDLALWSLRDYNIPDSAVELLVREGSEYVPTTLREMKGYKEIQEVKPGIFRMRQPDFLVQISHEYKFNPNDIPKLAESDVNYNIFDRIGIFKGSLKAGSLQQHVMDAASTINPHIVLGANVGVDKAAELERKLLELGKGYADKMTALPSDRQEVLTDMIKRANHDGIEYSYTQMVANGLTPEEIGAMKSWREFWDTVYVLENGDAARTLRNQGFKEFIDVDSDTKLFAKPTNLSGTQRVFNPKTQTIETMEAGEVQALKDRGGTLATTKSPNVVGDELSHLIAVEDSAGKNYLRGISDSSEVLEYRKGYYTVHYTDPYFVEEVVKNSRGEVLYRKAIASAGSRKDGELLAQRKMADNPETTSDFFVRRDVKEGHGDFDDVYWDLQQAKGRTSQRVRGKRLEGSNSNLSDMSQAPILGPVDSMVLSSKSISSRVSMRDMIETTKVRFAQKYGEFLPLNPVTKQPQLPNNASEIRYQGRVAEDSKKLGDARTEFNYINYLENGFINHLDDGYKSLLRSISDIAGHAGNKKIEKALQWASNKRGPSAMGKSIAFNAYLATNPVRQFVIQSFQMTQLSVNFPRWVVDQRAVPELMLLHIKQLGGKPPETLLKSLGMTSDEADLFFRQWINSGLSASIDKQNLLRGALADLTDEVTRKEIKPLTWVRKVGFDAGENINMMTAWLAHRDTAKRAGKDINNLEVLERIGAEARNYTYNMNRAGDMPYNQNVLALLFQFMQVPHKALLTMTSNRVLTPWQKFRLAGFNAVMFTLPPAAMMSLMGDDLPDDPFHRDIVINGLMGATFNKGLSLASGEETYIDWSDFAPLDMHGMYDFLHSLVVSDVGTAVAETPSGQLLFGNNPRITKAAKSMAGYFNYMVADEADPVRFSKVMKDFASISSGMSNIFKARAMREYGKKISLNTGKVLDPEITSMEVIAQEFGLSTMDATQSYWIDQISYEKSSKFREDVEEWYKNFRVNLIDRKLLPGEQEYMSEVMRKSWMVWGNDSKKARDIVDGLLRRDMANGDIKLYDQILRSNEIMSISESKALVEAIPDLSEEQRESYKAKLDAINDYKEKF